MEAKIITFNVAKQPSAIRSKLNRELNGYKDVSHGGRYKYKRQGLLDSIHHKKPSKNTIVVAEEPAKRIIDLLKKYGAEFKTINIQIDPEELKK